MRGTHCRQDRILRALAFFALGCAHGFWTCAGAAEQQISTLSPNQFVVIGADSTSASRLGSEYPGRLRRLARVSSASALNNVKVVMPTVANATFAKSVLDARPALVSQVPPGTAQPQCSGSALTKAPTDSFILVCTDGSNQVSERDQRAIRAFVQFAAQESQPLTAHVSGEREWEALERVLVARAAEPASRPVPFREVRYGDGLTPGQIKIERLRTN